MFDSFPLDLKAKRVEHALHKDGECKQNDANFQNDRVVYTFPKRNFREAALPNPSLKTLCRVRVSVLHGFTIVTANTRGGLVDVRDRRPVVLSAEDAAMWLNS